jgi:hypothetical protein
MREVSSAIKEQHNGRWFASNTHSDRGLFSAHRLCPSSLTLLGWVAALVWASTAVIEPQRRTETVWGWALGAPRRPAPEPQVDPMWPLTKPAAPHIQPLENYQVLIIGAFIGVVVVILFVLVVWHRTDSPSPTSSATHNTFTEQGSSASGRVAPGTCGWEGQSSTPVYVCRDGAGKVETEPEPLKESAAQTFTNGDIGRIIETYRHDELRFNRECRGKTFSGVLLLNNITTYYFEFGGSSDGVNCFISDRAVLNEVLAWKGLMVSVRGMIQGTEADKIQLTYCKFATYGGGIQGLLGGPPSQSQTMHEKVRSAVAAQYSCTPSLSDIKSSGSDSIGTVYFAGCGRWIYMVFINPQERIEVSRLTEWNGR